MTSIEFKKTGNFWIDNGIVGLYKVLRRIKNQDEPEIEFDLKLNSDGLVIKQCSLDENNKQARDLLSILNLAKR
jgi:hypothetical protein